MVMSIEIMSDCMAFTRRFLNNKHCHIHSICNQVLNAVMMFLMCLGPEKT